jgi:hypothetical protein
VVQYQAAFRDLATRHALDIDHSARLFAILNMTGADAAIACWRPSKRSSSPTATATLRPSLTPLFVNPPYPGYPSGHACLTGATANGLGHLFGARHIDLVVDSVVTGTTRHYLTEHTLDPDTVTYAAGCSVRGGKNRSGHIRA